MSGRDDPVQAALFGPPKPMDEAPPRPKTQNPCIALYGPGPSGTRCRTCQHLLRFRRGGTWRKCELRANTHGAATDHKASWSSCGRYVHAAGRGDWQV